MSRNKDKDQAAEAPVTETETEAPVTETETEAPVTETEAPKKQGRAITLPNGERRIDYIRRRYYEEGAKRGDIARELTEMTGKVVPYQIVFASTKEKLDAGTVAAEAVVASEGTEDATPAASERTEDSGE